MAKIVLSMDGTVLRQLTLAKERTTIGRSPLNDLVIDSLAVSGEHAVIALVGNDAVLEDLNSTNGTQVNGQPIKKHFLQENDVIELTQYRIEYIADSRVNRDNRDVFGDAGASSVAAIRVLTGANAGKEAPLTKVITSIGRPGVQVAVITQRGDGFYLSQVEGENDLLINGSSIAKKECRLDRGDIIDLVNVKIEFLLK